MKEIVPVIIGVLIALVINNWNEERKDKQYVTQIFSSIHEELEESNSDIEGTIPRQRVLLDSIGIYQHDDAVSLFDIVRKAGGIRFTTIRTKECL